LRSAIHGIVSPGSGTAIVDWKPRECGISAPDLDLGGGGVVIGAAASGLSSRQELLDRSCRLIGPWTTEMLYPGEAKDQECMGIRRWMGAVLPLPGEASLRPATVSSLAESIKCPRVFLVSTPTGLYCSYCSCEYVLLDA